MDFEKISYEDELVLIADDEEQFCNILQDFLKRRGIQANFTTNGKHALSELYGPKHYTFLLADIIMPGLDGLKLAEKVSKELPDIAVIMMTGYTHSYKYIDVINAGAIDFINKPFRVDELEAKIKRAIIERNIRSELQRLIITDSLTELYNQRHFYSRLKDEIKRAQRLDQKLAIIILDLDNFKYYNDTHGHIAGDELLQKFGKIIKTQIRQGVDSGYRYGGDEFAIILVDADEETCQEIEQRIERAFTEKCDQNVSMGHATYETGMTPETLVIHADKNLYLSKATKKQNHENEQILV